MQQSKCWLTGVEEAKEVGAQVVGQKPDEISFEENVEFGGKMMKLFGAAEWDQVIKQFVLRVIVQEKIFLANVVNPRLGIDHLGEKQE